MTVSDIDVELVLCDDTEPVVDLIPDRLKVAVPSDVPVRVTVIDRAACDSVRVIVLDQGREKVGLTGGVSTCVRESIGVDVAVVDKEFENEKVRDAVPERIIIETVVL